MTKESIGDLVVTIGADLGELINAFSKTASHIREIKNAVKEVNFDQMVKNMSVTARVIKSLRTQTVNGFADMNTSIKKVGKTIAETNKILSGVGKNLTSNLQRTSRSMQVMGDTGRDSTDKLTRGYGLFEQSIGSISRVSRAFHHSYAEGLAVLSAEFLVMSMAAHVVWQKLIYFPKKAIQSVDAYRLAVIKTQALISTFAPKDIDFDVSFERASKYARELVSEMDILAAYTMGTSFDLQAITQEFMKQGVLVDINSKKAKDAFLNIANAIEIIASGFQAPELQIRQEARALAMGQIDLRATLATELNARLNGQLKQRIALWKQEGTFVEHIGDLLQGYAASIADIRNTWKSTSALFKTMSDRILRFGSENFYDAINVQLRKMTNYLQEHEVLIATRLHAAWEGILVLASSLKRSYEIMQGPIQVLIELAGAFLKGWGFVLIGVIPVALERISLRVRYLYNIGKDLLLLWQQIGQAMADIGSDWSFSGTKAIEKSIKALDEEQKQILKILGNKKLKLFTQDFNSEFFKTALFPGYDEAVRNYKDFQDDIDAFMASLGKKDVKTPGIMPQIDRDKFLSEYDSFLNATSVKTKRWLDDEIRQIKLHSENLIRNKELLIQDEAAIAKHALSVTSNILPGGGSLGDIMSSESPFIRFKSMGIQEWLRNYIKIVADASKQTKEFTNDINAITDIQIWEKTLERQKAISAPSKAISQRYTSPMQKQMSELAEFIKTQKFEIEKLARLGLLSPEVVADLSGKLDTKAFEERGRIVEESYQKIRDEISKFDDFVAERVGGKGSLAAKITEENKMLGRAQLELSRIYTQGLITQEQYIKTRDEMEEASAQRRLRIADDFNSEMFLKGLSQRKGQLDRAAVDLSMSRGQLAVERYALSVEELKSELERLGRIEAEGDINTLDWANQKDKVEQLQTSIANLAQTVRETTGTFGEGLKYGILKYINEAKTGFEYGMSAIEDSANGMVNTITGIFSDLRNSEVKSWQDYALQIIDVFASIVEKMFAEMMILSALKALGIKRNTADTQGVITTSALTVALGAQIPIITALTAAYWALAIAKMAAGMGGMGGVSSSGTAGAATMGTASGGFGGILVSPPIHNGGMSGDDISGPKRASNESFANESVVVKQSIHFTIPGLLDAHSFDSYLDRSQGKLKRIMADGVDDSLAFKKKMRGR